MVTGGMMTVMILKNPHVLRYDLKYRLFLRYISLFYDLVHFSVVSLSNISCVFSFFSDRDDDLSDNDIYEDDVKFSQQILDDFFLTII